MHILVKLALMLTTSKEGRGAVKNIVAGIGIFFGFIIIVVGGFVSILGSLFGGDSDDIYLKAINVVKVEYSIENNLDSSIVRVVDLIINEDIKQDQSAVEQFIKEYFITSEEQEIEPEENETDLSAVDPSEPDGSESSEDPEDPPEPAIETVTRFKTLDEIYEMLKQPPFNASDDQVKQIQEIFESMGKGTDIIDDDSGMSAIGIFRWPVPSCTNISSPFGGRNGRNHNGIDIAGGGVRGAPIVASADGTVIRSVNGYGEGYYGCPDGGKYGNHVYISHGDGYVTRYAHCLSVTVKSGDTVKQGQVIGYVGNSGSSTGPHLHYEIRRNDTPYNPMNYFKRS